MRFLTDPPQFLFFTGKGGVGKTSVACASALELAARGKHVLSVSTDPASNIGQVFTLMIGNTVTAIPTVPGLSALEIDPVQAADAYRERIIAPVRGLLPETEIASITESLSGSCTTEIASFDEFTNLLTDDGAYGQYDHIVFDTAPTGAYHPVAPVAGIMDRIPCQRTRRRVMSRPAVWARKAQDGLCPRR